MLYQPGLSLKYHILYQNKTNIKSVTDAVKLEGEDNIPNREERFNCKCVNVALDLLFRGFRNKTP